MACCGRDRKVKQDVIDKAAGPIKYATSKRAVGGKCPVTGCGKAVGHSKRWFSGTRVRINTCADGHISPI